MQDTQDIIVLDIETKNDFMEVGGRENMHLLEVSLVGLYSYNDDRFFVVHDHEIEGKLVPILRDAGLTVGFNIVGFDFPVLEKYLTGIDMQKLPLLDLMDDPKAYLKFRPSLNALATATLKTQKSADGLEAIKMYREGRLDDLAKYCLDDVRITRDLFDYGKREGKVMFFDTKSMMEYAIPVSWQKYAQEEPKPDAAQEQMASAGTLQQKSLF